MWTAFFRLWTVIVNLGALPQFSGILAIDPRVLSAMVSAVRDITLEAAIALQEAPGPENRPYTVSEGMATIPLHGVMMKGGGWLLSLFGGTDTAQFTASVQAAAADPSVRTILLDIDSPGGSVAGCVEAAEAVAAARKQKPTYAYAGDCCDSAAYWIGSQASGIYGNAGTMAGSMGVFASIEDSSKAAERMGYKVHVVGSGPYKGAGEPGTEVTDEQLADTQRMVDAVAGVFVKAVSSGRKMALADVTKLADGRSWFGKEAVSKRLLDGLASREGVISALKGYKPGRQAVHIAATAAGEKPMSLWEQFKAALGGDHDTQAASPENPPAQAASPAPSTTTTTVLAAPAFTALGSFQGVEPLRAEIDAQKAEIARLTAAQAATVTAQNRAACEAHMRAGLFPAADLDKNVERRAAAPEIFDALMAERPQIPLTAGAITGDEAVTRLDPSASQGFLQECKKYFRGQNPAYAAKLAQRQLEGE